ncbi:MAG TPA: nucleotidyltransferase domain-containing protein [Verrucomicrobiae bacterium]|jgi:predicted nucleotidyltransferase
MILRRQIQDFAEKVAREFRPQKIILFGSHAYGRPGEDSDVDLLVIMPFRGSSHDKAVEIDLRLQRNFPMDLIVRTPAKVRERVRLGDGFMREIMEKGQVLYDVARA